MTRPTKLFWSAALIISSLTLYGLLAEYQQAPPIGLFSDASYCYSILGVSLVALMISLYFLPLKYVVYLVVIAIPFEFSTPLHSIRSLSPIDYFCAACMIATAMRLGFRKSLGRVVAIFSPSQIMLWAIFVLYGILDAYWSHGNIRGLLRWGEFLFAYFIAAMAANDAGVDLAATLSLILNFMGAAMAFIATIQFFASYGSYWAVYATFGQHNVLAAFLSLCIPAALYLLMSIGSPWRFLAYAFFSLIVFAFLISYSRAAWLGLLGAILIVSWAKRERFKLWHYIQRYYLVICLCLIGLSAFYFASARFERHVLSLSARNYYWKAARNIIRAHPVMGLGPGNYEAEISHYVPPEALRTYLEDSVWKKRLDFWQHLHSLYLQIMVQYGILGFTLWGLAFFSLVGPTMKILFIEKSDRGSFKPYFITSVLAFLLHNLFDILTVCSLDLLFAFLLAITIHSIPSPDLSRIPSE